MGHERFEELGPDEIDELKTQLMATRQPALT
jgi:hypothetical protein